MRLYKTSSNRTRRNEKKKKKSDKREKIKKAKEWRAIGGKTKLQNGSQTREMHKAVFSPDQTGEEAKISAERNGKAKRWHRIATLKRELDYFSGDISIRAKSIN